MKMLNVPMLSRRSFLKATAAVGATAAIYGCDTSSNNNYSGGGSRPDLKPDNVYFGSGAHNCGGRCITKAHTKNGRITRIVTDEMNSINGVEQDPNSFNNTQSRACARCRAYKLRLYHPGRLKYPLKQTKKRGDLTGFVRMSWDGALNEITRKHKAIINKYGPESIHNIYACGSYTPLQGGSYSGIWNGLNANSVVSNLVGGYAPYYLDYSFHQRAFFDNNYGTTGYTGYFESNYDVTDASNRRSYVSSSTEAIAGVVKTAVLWGSNFLSTVNPVANSNIHAYKEMRARGGNVLFIGPEFVDTGVNLATKWIQSKPYTDNAIINAMIYEMIVKTFDANGDLLPTPMLDVNYLDTMVYGFFDSPAYWVKTADGTITFTDPLDGSKKIKEVPAGKSLSAYIMGNDDRLTKARYDAGNNYIAQQFSTPQTFRNAGICSYSVTAGVANTKYNRKLDYLTPKTPEWAEAISGVPADTIRELAKIYCDEANHPIYTEWSGGQLKQAEGVATLFALQSLLAITKTYGRTAETLGRAGNAPISTAVPAKDSLPTISISIAGIPAKPKTPVPSVTMWHNAIKFAFGDVMINGGYDGRYIPDFDISTFDKGKVYHDDGGAKALVKMKRNPDGSLVESGGVYEHEVDGNGDPIYSGFRFIMNAGGNTLVNQHMNPNDSRQMFESIPSCGQTNDPDVADDLCLVSFDNFLSPSPRWSDYVLPAATNWEQDNQVSVNMGNAVFVPSVSTPPGEAKSTWDFTVAFLKAYEKHDGTKADVYKKLISSARVNSTVTDGNTYTEKIKNYYDSWVTSSAGNTSRFVVNGKALSFDDALKIQWQQKKPKDPTPLTAVTKTPLRTKIDDYLALTDATRKITPIYPGITAIGNNSYGAEYIDDSGMPNYSGRIHVYAERMVWQYEHRFEKWHGYLPSTERGQNNLDQEGDPIVLPIPMYFPYEDYFMEAYGGKDKLPTRPLLLTTTHDRYRAHSSQAETPLLRELTHRTRGGKIYSGNDWGSYATLGAEVAEGETMNIPRLNKDIPGGLPTASWSEILINNIDAAERDIEDGDLVEISNPIGAVRAIARVTKRCVKGMLGLHQGCWYDPDPSTGVDDGGNCNTLMATKPSRVDHGNGQQTAMVSIKKV